MERIIPKEEIDELTKIKGEVRGMALKNHEDFIVKEKGREGLLELEKAMSELGFPVRHQKIEPWDFYPVYLEVIELLVIKKLFNFEDRKFEEIGVFGSKVSFIVKMFLKYFGSIGLMADRAPKIWEKYYTIGDLKIKGLSEKERCVTVAIEDFCLHPIHCLHLKGYFSNMVRTVVGKETTCQETKCVHKGDSFHEFLLKW